jgi:nicotinate-nucleotide--dimethylbenzimidazole phosphoribosyltransferase
MATGLPFDDFRALMGRLPPANDGAADLVRAQFAGATAKAPRRIEDLAAWLARWTGRAPSVRRPLVALFAGNHGVAAQGVSLRPVEATAAAVELCAAGGAAINQVCVAHDLGLKVFDLALHLPTGDITQEAALDERGCAATMAFGMEAVAGGTDLLCVGSMGVGGSTVTAAMLAALLGGDGAKWTANEAKDKEIAGRQAAAVDAALALHRSHFKDPLEVLRRLGGREFAAIAGALLAARMERVPVIIDGAASIAAATVLHAMNPQAVAHCLVGAWPSQPALVTAVERLGLGDPVLEAGFGGGEGVGAGLAAGLVKTAALVSSGLAAAS